MASAFIDPAGRASYASNPSPLKSLTGKKKNAGGMFSGLADTLQRSMQARQQAALAEVDADAAEYEAQQNRAAGQQAFQFALSNATASRPVGGGLTRGGYGRRGATLGQATGGLAAANAAARKAANTKLAMARFKADPANQAAADLADTARTIGTGKKLDPLAYLRFRNYWNSQVSGLGGQGTGVPNL